jgi:hypothetical protein
LAGTVVQAQISDGIKLGGLRMPIAFFACDPHLSPMPFLFACIDAYRVVLTLGQIKELFEIELETQTWYDVPRFELA